MNVPALSSIHVYPIKSSGAINLSSTWIDDHGLSFDRRFVVSNLQGQCITARKHPKLCLVQSSLIINGIMLSAPNMPNLIIKYQQITSNYSNVSVWQDDIEAQKCHHSVNTWMS